MTNPIPKGYHSITPSLVVKDTTRAIEFYKKAFGARQLGEAMKGPGGKVMHAEIQIGDSRIMLNDEMTEMGGPNAPGGTLRSPMSLHIYVTNVDETWRTAISAGAKELMKVEEAFWGDRYGKLVDPFGYEWGLATHVKDMSDEEMMRAGQKAMQQMQTH